MLILEIAASVGDSCSGIDFLYTGLIGLIISLSYMELRFEMTLLVMVSWAMVASLGSSSSTA